MFAGALEVLELRLSCFPLTLVFLLCELVCGS